MAKGEEDLREKTGIPLLSLKNTMTGGSASGGRTRTCFIKTLQGQNAFWLSSFSFQKIHWKQLSVTKFSLA
ncbi:MAG: hypothetical protein IJJ71_01640 [Treponema sp.]|uniref:hypothetical protein n=1 Tax=Treponema sp. TaxID=166 RepID=UPI0025E113B5|nr:hypothetical protein [Treponema sp.]MBR0494862.1 hypothetical protein [Treponema sp.]